MLSANKKNISQPSVHNIVRQYLKCASQNAPIKQKVAHQVFYLFVTLEPVKGSEAMKDCIHQVDPYKIAELVNKIGKDAWEQRAPLFFMEYKEAHKDVAYRLRKIYGKEIPPHLLKTI